MRIVTLPLVALFTLIMIVMVACTPAAHRPTSGAATGVHAAMSSHAASKAVDVVLDDFHDAASKADLARYFSHFTPDFVFFGTDATERWPLAQFRAFCEPLFAKGKGWTYRTLERHVFIAPSGAAAWFDETLVNEKYGECRGTGALVLIDGVWRLSQYNLVIPVPNDFAPEVVRKGREQKEQLERSKPAR